MYKEYHCQADDFETFVREQLKYLHYISRRMPERF